MGDLIYRLLLFLNSSKENDINYNIAINMLKNIRLIPDMSINKLADLCYTSPAAITRFCHKLGYSSLIEFKRSIKINININEELIKKNTIDNNVSREIILDNMTNQIINEINNLKNFLDLKIVDRVIELIYSKNNICIFGTQFSQLMAQDLQRKLANLSKLIFHAIDVQDQEKLADTLDENSLAILISPTGKFLEYHERLWKKIKRSSTSLVVITERKIAEYEKRSDYIIYLPPKNNSNEYPQSHRYDLSFLIEYIYIRYGGLYSN
ncbi:MurR/RpiR family transcriptional regulator [Caproiciproducens sp. MSJ-32]|uniref:MurR/RpiR family transcriptional regulator n=1 Tax=Caproiciproducens sp. MSJ-32 TaxID=2841527 RepID=UPI001C1283C3|nr:MurR/RpiR family transcriptional regulator [Caproiciproducens sp. MSJ-32]MBU5455505.1 MurR/RpiR family transcriptional regulator [Caproiciproducens sp. MSJ-32]